MTGGYWFAGLLVIQVMSVILLVRKILKNSAKISHKYMTVMCLLLFLVLISDYFVIKLNLAAEKRDLQVVSMLFFTVSIVLVIIALYAVSAVTDNYVYKQNLAIMELKNDMILKSQKDMEETFSLWRKSIHDYKNNIIVLKQLADEGKIESIREYLDNESKIMEQKISYVKTGNSVVDAIINVKQNKAEEKGIIFIVNAAIPEKCYVKDIDMAGILGNLIDNAIEACEKERKPHIEVSIKKEKSMFIIKVANTFSKSLPRGMETTKSDSIFHGVGLKSVKRIVNKYTGVYEMIQRDGEVVTTIILSDSKNITE